MIEVEAPDGSVIEFPEGTADDVILNVMRREFGSPDNQTMRQRQAEAQDLADRYERDFIARNSDSNRGRTALGGFTKGATLGFADEIVGGIAGLFGGDASASLARNSMLGAQEADRQQFPVTQGVSEFAGAVTTPAPALSAGKLAGAIAGGAAGAGYGIGTADGTLAERIPEAGTSAAIGAAAGAAAPALAGMLRGRNLARNRRTARRNAPSIEATEQAAREVFDRADQVENLPRDRFTDAAGNLLDRMDRFGMDADVTPRAVGAARRLEEAATAPSPSIGFRELDTVRNVARNAAASPDRPEAALGMMAREGIDDFFEEVAPQMGAEVTEARRMWGQLRRHDEIQEAIRKAEKAASGYENGLRNEFRKIYNNKKKWDRYTDAEKAAIEHVIDGTVFGNNMKRAGKLGFGLSQQSNALLGTLSSAGGAGLGVALGGPVGGLVGAAIPGVVGNIGARASEALTDRAAQDVLSIIRAGGPGAGPEIGEMARQLLGLGNQGARGLFTLPEQAPQ